MAAAKEEIEEFRHKMAKDDEFCEAVAHSLCENEKIADKMLDDTKLAGKLTGHMLQDTDLLERVKGELEMQGFTIESAANENYETDDAVKDFQVLARACEGVAGGDPEAIAKAAGHDTSTFSRAEKSTQETDFTSAGLTIPTPMADELIPILDSEPVFIDAGAMVMEVPNGKMDIGRQNSDPTAQWQGEGDTVTVSDAGFDLLQLTSHKLTVGHEFSNDFLRRDGRLIGEQFMFKRMMRAGRNKLDSTVIEGGGGSNQPEGLIQQVDSSHVDTSSGNSITNISDDLKKKKRQLAGADIPEEARAWLMRPEVEIDILFDISSDETKFTFRQELAENGTLFGDDVRTTTNIGIDGSDNTNIYYVEMSEQLIGRGTNFEMATSPHEKFTQDLTILRLVSHWDYQMAHDKSAGVIEDYTLQ